MAARTDPGAKLFPTTGEEKTKRGNAAKKFWKMMVSVLEEHIDEVRAMGYEIEDLGTHSIWKGRQRTRLWVQPQRRRALL